MIVIGIDPGDVTGYAVLQDGICLKCGQNKAFKIDGRSLLSYDLESEKYLIIEDQFIAPLTMIKDRQSGYRYYSKAQKALKTTMHKGGWVYLAIHYGWQIYQPVKNAYGVKPDQWRKGIYGKSRMTMETAKAMSLQHVKMRFDMDLKNSEHHTAEAMLIALFGYQEIKAGLNHV